MAYVRLTTENENKTTDDDLPKITFRRQDRNRNRNYIRLRKLKQQFQDRNDGRRVPPLPDLTLGLAALYSKEAGDLPDLDGGESQVRHHKDKNINLPDLHIQRDFDEDCGDSQQDMDDLSNNENSVVNARKSLLRTRSMKIKKRKKRMSLDMIRSKSNDILGELFSVNHSSDNDCVCLGESPGKLAKQSSKNGQIESDNCESDSPIQRHCRLHRKNPVIEDDSEQSDTVHSVGDKTVKYACKTANISKKIRDNSEKLVDWNLKADKIKLLEEETALCIPPLDQQKEESRDEICVSDEPDISHSKENIQSSKRVSHSMKKIKKADEQLKLSRKYGVFDILSSLKLSKQDSSHFHQKPLKNCHIVLSDCMLNYDSPGNIANSVSDKSVNLDKFLYDEPFELDKATSDKPVHYDRAMSDDIPAVRALPLPKERHFLDIFPSETESEEVDAPSEDDPTWTAESSLNYSLRSSEYSDISDAEDEEISTEQPNSPGNFVAHKELQKFHRVFSVYSDISEDDEEETSDRRDNVTGVSDLSRHDEKLVAETVNQISPVQNITARNKEFELFASPHFAHLNLDLKSTDYSDISDVEEVTSCEIEKNNVSTVDHEIIEINDTHPCTAEYDVEAKGTNDLLVNDRSNQESDGYILRNPFVRAASLNPGGYSVEKSPPVCLDQNYLSDCKNIEGHEDFVIVISDTESMLDKTTSSVDSNGKSGSDEYLSCANEENLEHSKPSFLIKTAFGKLIDEARTVGSNSSVPLDKETWLYSYVEPVVKPATHESMVEMFPSSQTYDNEAASSVKDVEGQEHAYKDRSELEGELPKLSQELPNLLVTQDKTFPCSIPKEACHLETVSNNNSNDAQFSSMPLLTAVKPLYDYKSPIDTTNTVVDSDSFSQHMPVLTPIQHTSRKRKVHCRNLRLRSARLVNFDRQNKVVHRNAYVGNKKSIHKQLSYHMKNYVCSERQSTKTALPSLNANLLDGCFEDGTIHLSHFLEFLSQFLVNFTIPSHITDPLTQNLLTDHSASQSHLNSAQDILQKIIISDNSTIDLRWSTIETCLQGTLTSDLLCNPLPFQEMFLNLAVTALKMDLYSRNLSDHLEISRSKASRLLSQDVSPANRKNIMKLILKGIHSVANNWTKDGCTTELMKVLHILQELLALCIEVSSCCKDCAMSLAGELKQIYQYLPNLSTKHLFLRSITSELLLYYLTELILESHYHETLPLCELSLEAVVTSFFKAVPQMDILSPPTTPSDDISMTLTWSPSKFLPEQVEELAMLLFLVTKSYLQIAKGGLHMALRRRTVCQPDEVGLSLEDKEVLKNWTGFTDRLRKHLCGLTQCLTPRTSHYLLLIECLKDSV